MGQLTGKVCLVTGAASGIGKAIASTFVREGARVVAADLDEVRGEALTSALGAERSVYRKTDVSKEADIAAAIELAVERYGRLDCLVNNAGIPGRPAKIEDIQEEDFHVMMNVDLLGVLMGMKHAVPVMRKQRTGCIISISSALGERTGGVTLYNIAKAGVNHLTRCIAVEVGKDNIRVNAISPGMTATPIMAKALGLDNGEETLDALTEALADCQPIERGGQPQDIANMAAFIASDRADFVTGQVITVDGGFTVRPNALDVSKQLAALTSKGGAEIAEQLMRNVNN
ncbi:MAG: SDR family oxidoreductase [Caldilineaceae bacterium]|nr:SDR family oxidoreductase [Caldilineaceae bacterium]